jgi:hypothetical protein
LAGFSGLPAAFVAIAVSLDLAMTLTSVIGWCH